MSEMNRPKGIRKEVRDLLERGDLWRIVDEALGVRIREDPVARQATFAVMLTAFQRKPVHLMLIGESALGKSWLLANTIQFIPTENQALIGSSTQRAWFYCGEEVMRPHPIIPDTEIIDHYEVNWRNKVVGILDNVTPQTIKDLKPVMSHDAEEVDIQTSEQGRGGGRWQTRRVRVIGCPSFVNCSTWLKWDAELSSRHFYLTPRDDPKKYEASAELLDDLHTTGILPTSQVASQIQDAIRWLRDANLQVVIAKDTAAQIKADFKWNSGRDIRDYERLLTLVEAVAWLHSLQRERANTGAVIADNRDLEIVKRFSDELLKTIRTGTSAQVLDYYEKVLKPLSESAETLTYDAIQQKYFEVYSRRLHRDILILYNKTLQDLNKIDLIKDPVDRRRWVVHVLQPAAPPQPLSFQLFT